MMCRNLLLTPKSVKVFFTHRQIKKPEVNPVISAYEVTGAKGEVG